METHILPAVDRYFNIQKVTNPSTESKLATSSNSASNQLSMLPFLTNNDSNITSFKPLDIKSKIKSKRLQKALML